MNKTPNDDYWWSERRKPLYYNDDNLGELTKEEWKQIERQEKMGLETDMKEAREMRKRKLLKSVKEANCCFSACMRAL